MLFRELKKLLSIYYFDFKKYWNFSAYNSTHCLKKEQLIASICVNAHTIEKGLTMPQKKLNFGHDKIKRIYEDLNYYVQHYGADDERFKDVVGILKEYRNWHAMNNCRISDDTVILYLENMERQYPDINNVSQIYGITRNEYFSFSGSSFKEFSLSRHSCRNFGGKVDTEDLRNALELAVKTVPSTCNRQSVRVHVIDSKEILSIQQGNRGFGDRADKFLLITSALSHWKSGSHRTGPFVDGGIFLMNLLYALHYYKIGACTLNMYQDEKGTCKVQKLYNIPSDEVLIALIAIGNPADKFDLARSTRRAMENIVTFH